MSRLLSLLVASISYAQSRDFIRYCFVLAIHSRVGAFKVCSCFFLAVTVLSRGSLLVRSASLDATATHVVAQCLQHATLVLLRREITPRTLKL